MGAITSTQVLTYQVAALMVLVLLVGLAVSTCLAQHRANYHYFSLQGDVGLQLQELARVLAILFVAVLVSAIAAGGSVAWVH